MSRIITVLAIAAVLMVSLVIVVRAQNTSLPFFSHPNISNPFTKPASTPSNIDSPQADLTASNDVNSVDQIEADNLADNIALDPNQ